MAEITGDQKTEKLKNYPERFKILHRIGQEQFQMQPIPDLLR